jgi:hypothetical protein
MNLKKLFKTRVLPRLKQRKEEELIGKIEERGDNSSCELGQVI